MTPEQKKIHNAIAAVWSSMDELALEVSCCSSIEDREFINDMKIGLGRFDRYWNGEAEKEVDEMDAVYGTLLRGMLMLEKYEGCTMQLINDFRMVIGNVVPSLYDTMLLIKRIKSEG